MNLNDTPNTDALDDQLCGEWDHCYHQMHKHAIRLEIRARTAEAKVQELHKKLQEAASGGTITATRLKTLSVAELVTWLNNQEDQETRKITIPTT